MAASTTNSELTIMQHDKVARWSSKKQFIDDINFNSLDISSSHSEHIDTIKNRTEVLVSERSERAL